jgi:hypothetical protein
MERSGTLGIRINISAALPLPFSPIRKSFREILKLSKGQSRSTGLKTGDPTIRAAGRLNLQTRNIPDRPWSFLVMLWIVCWS